MRKLLFLCVLALSSTANAWEAQTTHAGLAEASAESSKLHARLVMLGFAGGLYEPLTVTPADGKELLQSLSQYAPTGGFTPDQRGRQFAVGWLVAGSVLADSSPSWSVNHFFDPTTGKGASLEQGFVDHLRARIAQSLGRPALPDTGVAAPDWVVAKDNPLNYAGFVDQYASAVRGGTPAERQRHMAGALVAAGAIVHVLEDMASPTHVRGDMEAHLSRLGPDRDDLGSRFERIAALAYGRLGVPDATPIDRPTLRAFFTDPDGKGLADWTASTFFSADTLPRPIRVGSSTEMPARQAAALVRPMPTLPSRLNLLAATGDDPTTLSGADGTCLARYHVDKGTVSFSTDDDCMLSQVGAIMPVAVGYGAGLLDWLFRGQLEVTKDPAASGKAIVVADLALGAGTLEVLGEDDRGVRTEAARVQIASAKPGDPIATIDLPANAKTVYVLYTGADAGGEDAVAVGSITP